jgi:plastocyanin
MPRRASRRSASSRRALASLAAALGTLACCLGPSAAVETARPATHTVVMEAVSFQPGVLTVKTGDSIVWRNQDPFPHTATSSAFDSQSIAPGQSWTYTAKTRGEFPYVCTFHPTMKGTLRVQ